MICRCGHTQVHHVGMSNSCHAWRYSTVPEDGNRMVPCPCAAFETQNEPRVVEHVMPTRITEPTTGGQKEVKNTSYALIPTKPLEEYAKLLHYGANKYEARNWEKGFVWSEAFNSMMRHANAFWGGEDIDRENGTHHMASVVFYAMAFMEWARTHPELDDRPKEQSDGEAQIKWDKDLLTRGADQSDRVVYHIAGEPQGPEPLRSP